MNYVEMIEDMTTRGWVVSIQPSLTEDVFVVRAEMPMGIEVSGAAAALEQAIYNTWDLTISVENNL